MPTRQQGARSSVSPGGSREGGTTASRPDHGRINGVQIVPNIRAIRADSQFSCAIVSGEMRDKLPCKCKSRRRTDLVGEGADGRHECPRQAEVSDLETAVTAHQQVLRLEVPAVCTQDSWLCQVKRSSGRPGPQATSKLLLGKECRTCA